jgi:hypothetical protein
VRHRGVTYASRTPGDDCPRHGQPHHLLARATPSFSISGFGALEAAVIAGLVAAGMDHTIAVPAVVLYRLATFWLPILPGWAAFT